jgi:hypothetical protein
MSNAAKLRALLAHCEKTLAFFEDNIYFPHEHGNKEIGEAWGAIADATDIARELLKASQA